MTPEDELRIAHSKRFRRVSNLYPRIVAWAYGADLAAAARATDAEVAARVVEWEREQGREPRDWAAQGRSDDERGES